MKKIICIVLSLLMLVSLFAGCDKNDKKAQKTDKNNSSSASQTSSVSEGTDSSEAESTNTSSDSASSDFIDFMEDNNVPVSKDDLDEFKDTTTNSSSATSSKVNSSVSQNSSVQTPSSSSDNTDNKTMAEKLRGGINLTCLENAQDAATNYNLWVWDRKYYDVIYAKGFDHIRLPVRFTYHVVTEAPDYTLDDGFMRLLDTAINNALDAGLKVVVDFHHSCYLNEGDKFQAIWEQVSKRYQHYPEELMFELVNEPSDVNITGYLNPLMTKAYNAIRQYNPTRTVAFACSGKNNTYYMWSTEFPSGDKNTMLSIHNYSPTNFTYQGLSYHGNKLDGQQLCTDAVKKSCTATLEKCLDYEKRTSRQVWVSECGMYLGAVDQGEAAKYLTHLTKECARMDLSYAIWEFNSGFGLFNLATFSWKEQLVKDLTMNW